MRPWEATQPNNGSPAPHNLSRVHVCQTSNDDPRCPTCDCSTPDGPSLTSASPNSAGAPELFSATAVDELEHKILDLTGTGRRMLA